jgi:hypothetical protein
MGELRWEKTAMDDSGDDDGRGDSTLPSADGKNGSRSG